jgi:hypothetical protein
MMRWHPITHRSRTRLSDRNQPPEPRVVSQAASHGTFHAVSHEEIARVAYSYWEARGRQGGSAAEDWFRAERELQAAIAAGGGPSIEANRSAPGALPRNKEYSP